MTLAELFPKDVVIADLSAKDKKGIVRELVARIKDVASPPGFKVSDVIEKVMQREAVGSTAIGGGVAIPHAKIENIKGVHAAFGRCSKGVDFNALDKEPVYLVFVIVAAPTEQAYSTALTLVARAIHTPNFCRFLKDAKDTKAIGELFAETDETLKA
jgi:mannitol/fructose-specific phosphotransferase system IIA component (Ntr-type)